MAHLYPPTWIEDRQLRGAELSLYRACQKLSSQWLVVHDKSWIGNRNPQTHPYWQADFLIGHPDYGLFLLGVKGGGVFIDKNVWYTRDHYGTVHRLGGTGRNPLDVDYDAVRDLYRKLKREVPTLPKAIGNILALPGCQYPPSFYGVGIERERIIDVDDILNLEEALIRSLKFWSDHEGFPTGEKGWFQSWLNDLIPMLAPSTDLSSGLGSTLRHEQHRLNALTEEQSNIWVSAFTSDRFAVSGCAGSGKTVLAQLLARRWSKRKSKHSVLLCCYNRPLAMWLRQNLHDAIPALRIATIQELWQEAFSFLNEQLHIDSFNYPPSKISEEIIAQARVYLRNSHVYEAIIVDEAQDFKPVWWKALEIRLAPSGKLAVFYDNNQAVYDNVYIPNNVLNTYSLSVNLRTTQRIHDAILYYYRGSTPPTVLKDSPVGDVPLRFVWSTFTDQVTLLSQIIGELISKKNKVSLDDIAIIAPLEDDIDHIRDIFDGFDCSEPGDCSGMVLSTIRRFKGLERPVVIVTALQSRTLSPRLLDELFYIAYSRAKIHLILVIHEDLRDDLLFPTLDTDPRRRPRPELLAELTKEQEIAVKAAPGITIIRAGAGSGKTRVLANRIAYLVDAYNVPPESVTAVTFTKKAAQELRRRVSLLLSSYESTPNVNTFHGLAVQILKQNIPKLPDRIFHGRTQRFSIVEGPEKVLTFILKDEEERILEEAIKWIDNCKTAGITVKIAKINRDLKAPDKCLEIWRIYEQYLCKHNLMDFNDVLIEAVDLLKDNPHIRIGIQSDCLHLLVDEFQDTNRPQFDLVRLLVDPYNEAIASMTRSLTVVGDAQQAIYGWRGAEYRIFRDLKQHYPNAIEYTLSINHRSDPPVITVADALSNAKILGVPPLYLTARSSNRDVILDYIESSTVKEETQRVAKYILGARQSYQVEWKEIAILLRSPNSVAGRNTIMGLQQAFLNYNIPCRSYGITPLHCHPMIEVVTALLCALADPTHDYYLTQWLSCKLFKNVGPSVLDALKKQQQQVQAATLWDFLWPVQERTSRFEDIPIGAIKTRLKGIYGIGDARREELSEAIYELLRFQSQRDVLLSRQSGPIHDLLLRMATQLRLESRLAKYMPKHAPEDQDTGEGALTIWRNLVTDALLETDNLREAAQVVFFEGADFSDTENAMEKLQRKEQAVQILSIHSSKGREYDLVFILGFENGVFPSDKASTREQIQEEARVCYVAVTRARHHLVLSVAYDRMDGVRNTKTLDRDEQGKKEFSYSQFLQYLQNPVANFQYTHSPSIYPVSQVQIILKEAASNHDMEAIYKLIQANPGAVPVIIHGNVSGSMVDYHIGSVAVDNERQAHLLLSDDRWNIVCDVDPL